MIATIRIWLVLAFAVSWLLLLLPLQLLGLFLGKLFGSYWLSDQVPVLFHRGVARIIDVRIHVSGNLEKSRPLMLVANHVSWLDIIVLSTIAPVSFVAKIDMKTWPLFGQLAQLQRTVFVRRESRRTAGQQANEIAQRLKQNDVMILFPEGTTSDGNGLLPFKTPLFEAARFALVESKLESAMIQPVALNYSHLHGMALGRQWRQHVAWPGDIGLGESIFPILRAGALDVTIRFSPAIEMTAESKRKIVAQQTHTAIRDQLTGR